MEDCKYSPSVRQVLLFQLLLSQTPVTRMELMDAFQISKRTLDRDIACLRNALPEMAVFEFQLPLYTLIFDPEKDSYHLIKEEFYG